MEVRRQSVPETKVRKENSCLLYDDEKGSLIYAENAISGKVIVADCGCVCDKTGHRTCLPATLILPLFPRLPISMRKGEMSAVARRSKRESPLGTRSHGKCPIRESPSRSKLKIDNR